MNYEFGVKKGGISRLESSMSDFRETIDTCGLIDPGFTCSEFTWCNNHVNSEIIWERLDRFLMNIAMQEKCSFLNVQHLAFHASDHRPIIAEWDRDHQDRTNLGKKRMLRFEESWTKYEDCKDIILQVWRNHNTQEASSVQDKIKKCLIDLKKWSCDRYRGSLRGAILSVEKELQGWVCRNDVQSMGFVKMKERELAQL